MPNRILILALAPSDSWLRHYTVSNPPRVPFIHREAMLNELDTMIARQRRLCHMDNVHALFDTAHWVSRWPISEVPTSTSTNL